MSKKDTAVAFAPAKLNLHLEILGKRADGYHALETVMLPIDLFDTIEARRTSGDIALSIENGSVPADASNLVWKAAALLQATSQTLVGASIRLTKRIPSEAGLGGGSSDAALTLRLLNDLWDLYYPIEHLSKLANELGSDVGFFLHDSAALCTGRGEIVEPIPVAETLHFVLVKPDVGASTAKVFAALASLLPSPLEGEGPGVRGKRASRIRSIPLNWVKPSPSPPAPLPPEARGARQAAHCVTLLQLAMCPALPHCCTIACRRLHSACILRLSGYTNASNRPMHSGC